VKWLTEAKGEVDLIEKQISETRKLRAHQIDQLDLAQRRVELLRERLDAMPDEFEEVWPQWNDCSKSSSVSQGHK